ncbi:hypothetical protein [Pontibacter vulgaris]|uniref:hypothetical protein n=1 Tax=Pontibacter vulgaris TaxID=2905679 RepID=UPI001FA79BB1|nr:hypothetical protein [Pontibacter vulgaris]
MHLQTNYNFIKIFLPVLVMLLFGCSQRFSHSVQQIPPPKNYNATSIPDYKDSTIAIAPNPGYDHSKLFTLFYGKHYRNAWATPVQVKVLDIGTAKGGLTPLKSGGSRQSINLRLQAPDSTEYVLRSIDKDPASALPEKWRKSYPAHILRDATSATHPYAALVLPHMAEAIGVYHTDPELVFVPHDPRLGEFVQKVGGMMALLEKRPSGDQSGNPNMGNAKHIQDTEEILQARLTDNDNSIDARQYLRSRLFDMLIGDWSRHEDNWRWAEFKSKNGNAYQAIPRDRDNVFYKLTDAPIPWLFMRTGFRNQFQTYRPKVNDIKSLNESGRNLDDLLLSGLSLKDWQEVADSIKLELTDEVIEEAFRAMPDTIYKLTAAPIINSLKTRRNNIQSIASSYFKELATSAIVVGTDKHETYEIKILSADEVQVSGFKTTKEGERKDEIFNRIYHASTTKELSLFGLDGRDIFIVEGHVKPRISIKIRGGAGVDSYTVKGHGSKLGKQVWIEDSKYKNKIEADKYTKVKVNDNPPANTFTSTGWLLRYYLN